MAFNPRPLVYIAGPLTTGDWFSNVGTAIDYAEGLDKLGYDAMVPHLGALWHMKYARTYEAWMATDFNYLLRCDALLRLPGDSPGADREVVFATERGIPVFTCVDDLVKGYPTNRGRK